MAWPEMLDKIMMVVVVMVVGMVVIVVVMVMMVMVTEVMMGMMVMVLEVMKEMLVMLVVTVLIGTKPSEEVLQMPIFCAPSVSACLL